MVAECAGNQEGDKPSPGCDRFLAANERARLQWKLEKEFTSFEKEF
jgi:adenosine deaminase